MLTTPHFTPLAEDDLDDLRPLAQAAMWVPRRRGGRRCAPSTIWRWGSRGLRGVRLRVTCVGGTAMTSRRWLAEFFEALAERAGLAGTTVPPAPRTTIQRRRASERAAARLAARGV